jgi:hypothetical protein
MKGREMQFMAAVNDCSPVSGVSHNLYKYPARFSPIFVREIIASMTQPGDIILDPFMGGGTSLVEAMIAGRDSLGLDINELAVFVSGVKTTIFSDKQLRQVLCCVTELSHLSLSDELNAPGSSECGYFLNMDGRHTWRIRNFLKLCLTRIAKLDPGAESDLIRCVILRTAQWALDCRKQTPTVQEFRCRLKVHAEEAIRGAREFRREVVSDGRRGKRPRTLCLLRSAVGAEGDERIRKMGRPSLVITSPPYPGVHVLYHRWQVKGRRETAAPYWIANLTDGQGASYYTFADRNRASMEKYLEAATKAFASVRQLVIKGTPLVQMVAFADPGKQLAPYLRMLNAAGWSESRVPGTNGRLWRTVPGRKWYTSIVASHANRELVLFHAAE